MDWLFRYALLLFVAGFSVQFIQAEEAETSEDPKFTYVLATGVSEGNYYRAGREIASWLNQALSQSRVVAVPSEGSVDNLNRLKEGSADIIIVQRDQLTDAYYAGTNPFSDIEILLPLFPEALQIFVAGKRGVVFYDAFAEKIESGSIEHIALPQADSTTYDTTRRVINILV